MTQTKAVDLSRNLSINCVDLGSSPTRSLVARGVSLEVGKQRGTIWVEEDSPSRLLTCLWPAWGHDPRGEQAPSARRGSQNTNPSPVLRAFPRYGCSVISQYFLLHVFPNLAEGLFAATTLPFAVQPLACAAGGAAAVGMTVGPPHPLYPLLPPAGVRSVLHYSRCNPECWVKTASK